MARIDVFVTSTIETTGVERLREQLPDIAITIHTIDGIEHVTTTLSQGLPVNSDAARRMALKRMQRFGEAEKDQLRASAESLLLARQLGVDRYPAVVFDRHWVVYGVTDLANAYSWFQARIGRENE